MRVVNISLALILMRQILCIRFNSCCDAHLAFARFKHFFCTLLRNSFSTYRHKRKYRCTYNYALNDWLHFRYLQKLMKMNKVLVSHPNTRRIFPFNIVSFAKVFEPRFFTYKIFWASHPIHYSFQLTINLLLHIPLLLL